LDVHRGCQAQVRPLVGERLAQRQREHRGRRSVLYRSWHGVLLIRPEVSKHRV
jgi:hypothetical protein